MSRGLWIASLAILCGIVAASPDPMQATGVEWFPCPLFTSYHAGMTSGRTANGAEAFAPELEDALNSLSDTTPKLGLRSTEHVPNVHPRTVLQSSAVPTAMCAMIDVPLFHDGSHPGTIAVFVKKLPAAVCIPLSVVTRKCASNVDMLGHVRHLLCSMTMYRM